MKLKNIIPLIYLFIGTLVLPQPSLAEEKNEVIPIIQSSKGLSEKCWKEARYTSCGSGISRWNAYDHK